MMMRLFCLVSVENTIMCTVDKNILVIWPLNINTASSCQVDGDEYEKMYVYNC